MDALWKHLDQHRVTALASLTCHVTSLNDEEIVVADTHNDRLLLLNQQLMLQQVLVTWHPQSRSEDACGPFRLHCDSPSGRLLVGLANGHLDIYQLRV